MRYRSPSGRLSGRCGPHIGIPSASRLQTPRLMLALSVAGLLIVACAPKRVVIPDPRRLHQLAEDTPAVIYVETKDGKTTKQKVVLPAGTWTGSQALIEGLYDSP